MAIEVRTEAADIIEKYIAAKLVQGTPAPLVLGLCGAQGSGKTTLAAILERRLRARGFKVALLSLDDLYLPREEREILADQIHPLLITRGVPGTHDARLGRTLIEAFGKVGTVVLPTFSKANDTRCANDASKTIPTPVDIVIFEGWCVGAMPQPPLALVKPVNTLESTEDGAGRWRTWVNDQLAGEYRDLFANIDMLVLLAAPDFSVVEGWRTEQEHDLRQELKNNGIEDTTLSDKNIYKFIQHYQRITEHVLEEMPSRADIFIKIDKYRHVMSVAYK